MEKTIYFAGGCFWCMAPVFRDQIGVESVVSGYAGGIEPNPSYEDVKNGRTRHRETVCVRYDPARIDFDTLLTFFLWNVDPFDGEGQFIDRGASYTLAVFYTDTEEKKIATEKIAALSKESGKQTFIAIEPFRSFYPAEEYHQDYDLKNPLEYAREHAISGRPAIRLSKS